MQAFDLAGAADDTGRSLFCAVPRPEEAVEHPQWRTAMRRVEAALGQPGIVAIIGPPGTGKTLLLHSLAQRLRAAGQVPVLLQQRPTSDSRKPDVILIDQPDRLPASMLDTLAQHRRPVVLTGSPDMADRLRMARGPVTIVTLAPLPPDDAAMFLKTQLAQAGQPADLLHPDAVARLIQRSEGVPRTLQMLAGLSVFMARLGDADQVTAAHVERAALVQHGTDLEDGDEDDGDGDEPSDDAALPEAAPLESAAGPAGASPHARGWRRPAALALGVLGCAVAGGWVLMPRDPLASLSSTALPPAPQPILTSPSVPVQQAAADAHRPAPASQPAPEQPRSSIAFPEPPVPRAVPAPQLRPLPPSVPVHITVTYPPGDAEAGTRAADVAGKLRGLGYRVPPPETGTFRGEPAVLYAFAEDAPAAAALARALGLGATQIRPAAMPRPGAVRVAVAPTSATPARRAPAAVSQIGVTR